MKKAMSLALAAAMALSMTAAASTTTFAASSDLDSLDPVELGIAFMGSESSMVGQWSKLFKEKVETASNGKITITEHPNAELGSDSESIEALLDNTIQIAAMQPSPAVAFVPELGVFDLPCAFAAADAETINTALNDSEFAAAIESKFENSGLRVLGFTQGATFREMTSNKKITAVEDLKGLNFRVMDNANQIQFWGALGCNTTPVPGSELYMSLQNGLVDSQENALDTLVLMGAPEVQKYVTMTNHSLYTNCMIMSNAYFTSLPEAYQEVINTAIKESETEMIPIYQEANETARKTLEEAGMEFTDWTDAEYAQVVEIAQPVYDTIRGNIGDEIVDSLLGAIQK